ncbi:MAG: hypothetical protein V1863_01550 [Candidatus Omnitrophota bacterium]
MRRTIFTCGLLGMLLFLFCSSGLAQPKAQRRSITVRVFHSPHCMSCIKVNKDVIPAFAQKYGSQVRWRYYDIELPENHQIYLHIERKDGPSLGTPTILVGGRVLVGMSDVVDNLESAIEEALAAPSTTPDVPLGRVDLMEHFRSFGPLTVAGAGLVDGINPCAFTVIVFFISFLSFMGYRRREMAVIGAAYILAVFLTYLALGFGFFKAIYGLQYFYTVSKTIYVVIGGLSLFLGCLAVNDYLRYKKTGNTDQMSLQMPRAIKNRIHTIVGNYYRRDKLSQSRAMLGLASSALVVGFMVSLLEAVCTGQLYLPTIIFVLKEGALRARAMFYLFLYNFMFIIPLVVVLVLALTGMSSRNFEAFGRRHMGLIKIAMAVIFFSLGLALWLGVRI